MISDNADSQQMAGGYALSRVKPQSAVGILARQ
jgi:hypothetical protein